MTFFDPWRRGAEGTPKVRSTTGAATEEGFREQRPVKADESKGTGINWIGPDEYQKWIDRSFAEFKGIADEMGWGK